MSLQQTASNYAGTAVTGTGFLGFLAAAEPYMKFGLAVLTAAAAITTVWVNIKRIRSKKPE